jgi:hypothetical protein
MLTARDGDLPYILVSRREQIKFGLKKTKNFMLFQKYQYTYLSDKLPSEEMKRKKWVLSKFHP